MIDSTNRKNTLHHTQQLCLANAATMFVVWWAVPVKTLLKKMIENI